ncbi:hypothetical protein N7532_007787 [Penicillium argentinense]|uniref:Uncharacterized protein n=1 Tax=Penicillium argentinense TaxID=1131581 RepID=A0A9W9EW38_9EURO|nr:uncharacterized protein N7532_007787 [Penicillium argentinense]KAJ5089103.1 hypothetical protein N7532_007787 [Penicillium argentinense]
MENNAPLLFPLLSLMLAVIFILILNRNPIASPTYELVDDSDDPSTAESGYVADLSDNSDSDDSDETEFASLLRRARRECFTSRNDMTV